MSDIRPVREHTIRIRCVFCDQYGIYLDTRCCGICEELMLEKVDGVRLARGLPLEASLIPLEVTGDTLCTCGHLRADHKAYKDRGCLYSHLNAAPFECACRGFVATGFRMGHTNDS